MDTGDNRASFIEHMKVQILTLEQAIIKMEEEIVEKKRQIEALKEQIAQ